MPIFAQYPRRLIVTGALPTRFKAVVVYRPGVQLGEEYQEIAYDWGKQRNKRWRLPISGEESGSPRISAGVRNLRYGIRDFTWDTLETPTSTLLYGGSASPIWWYYDERTHTAIPTGLSSGIALYQEAKQSGSDVTRKKYHLSPDIPLPDTAPQLLSVFSRKFEYPIGISSIRTHIFDLKNIRAREVIAGYSCDVFRSNSAGLVVTYWLEPKSGIVLKESHQIKGLVSQRIPPEAEKVDYIVKSITFPKSIPYSEFQIPRGSVVLLPRTMWNTPLPSGVMRKPMPAPRTATGFLTKPDK